MCIRDRHEVPVPAGDLGVEEVLLAEDAEEVLGDDERPHVRAVSYTHLRAHETVLDIVCRLLLEKKNKTTKMAVRANITNK